MVRGDSVWSVALAPDGHVEERRAVLNSSSFCHCLNHSRSALAYLFTLVTNCGKRSEWQFAPLVEKTTRSRKFFFFIGENVSRGFRQKSYCTSSLKNL